ncbi:hypothetical protein [Methylobacterium aerolatum]|uniref:Uncharacterized protein n=1 Tax=Methylobacterium aerolatum TaxID=418708 RepID=A0ABU0I209_9HYPH|nr:hypothetical protein [Methylobacterium aerolatum]MDQ0448643.1 hypothetical protein [Methylobacterium aerolatum]GJD37295.1 hypothetical protein FMGBMHLM_4223 [Methylobacterium aerolatum]
MRRDPGSRAGGPIAVLIASLAIAPALAQTVEDGSGAEIGAPDTTIVLDLIRRELDSPDAKVTVLRRSGRSHVCGSVNVKNRDGLYTGERGFVVDLETRRFGRVPDGPELLSPRSAGFAEKEAIRQSYFRLCLDG